MSQPAKSRRSSSSSSSQNTTNPDNSSSKTTTTTTAPTILPPRPSACIILLSPTNEILLLHRVQTSTSFPSAHVFPGGNLSPFHEPALPPVDTPEYHQDSRAYRLAALRETFEESGILLAKKKKKSAHHHPSTTNDDDDSSSNNAPLIHLPDLETATAARKAIHADAIKFTTWVEETLQARLCVDELVPFTRWVTPPWNKQGSKRFTTQMYLGFMPLSSPAPNTTTAAAASNIVVEDVHHHHHQTPTSDGGIEHTAATFAPASEWLARQRRGEIFLFPPQCFLLTMVARAFAAVPAVDDTGAYYEAQRAALLRFVRSGGGAGGGSARSRETVGIPWTEKVMSPEVLFRRESDGRLVLGVDKPGLELKGTGRGGDYEKVVLVNFTKEGPRDVEVRDRAEVMNEQKSGLKDKIMKL
ncbi:hypothetical protein N0V82_004868 [Gnomoniopsis sp. IMI 355080]|nr:hypothetical protein N0V82_004868 [Gnomoniopsis sp. IMI 355080]